jgi:Lecithin:cholesterol acyltransferase
MDPPTLALTLSRFRNQPGVQIRPHDFGGLQGIISLDPSDPKLTATYLPLVSALGAAGYVERVNMWGAPYDWRFAADGLAMQGVADAMQALIEMAVSTAGGQPAVIIAHSMVRPPTPTAEGLAHVQLCKAVRRMHTNMFHCCCCLRIPSGFQLFSLPCTCLPTAPSLSNAARAP